MKKRILSALVLASMALCFWGCGAEKIDPDKLTVLNYGKYIDPAVLEMFEEETGITVEYEEYESPEEMYAKYKAGSIDYDVCCTSDYMIQKLAKEGEVLPLDYDNIPLVSNLDSTILGYAANSYDKDNLYSLPYFYGTVGILYNKKFVDASEVNSWDVLFDEKYAGQIIMENSVRDTFIVPLRQLGCSINTTDTDKLDQALDILVDQKPLVYAYFVDETGDQMVAENASLALVYSGEAAYAESLNDNLAFSVPKEGSDMWIDAWFLPSTCKHKENAEKFLNFLCRADVAALNFDYVYYATPNTAVYDSLDEETRNDATIFPPKDVLENCEIFESLDEEMTNYYTILWEALKSY